MLAPLGSWVVFTLALVLASAGVGKWRAPGAASSWGRAAAVGELVLSGAAILLPGRAATVALAVVFAAFGLVHLASRRAADRDCGCLGEQAPASPGRAAAMTATSALAAAAVASLDPHVALWQVGHRPAVQGILALAAALPGALLWRRAFTGRRLPMDRLSVRLVDVSAAWLERRLSRRTMLQRLAVGGSALLVAPLRFLLYPGSALAAVVPGDCSTGLCTDGYTVFCCEINQGANSCPEGTFVGGWWMCTDYPGRRLCSAQGVRYYIDCNRTPGTQFPGGCRCGGDSCSHRRQACNVFRYGQCNTHVQGVTEVVCRVVLCENPSGVPDLGCGNSLAVDNATCGHDVSCLEPFAVPVGGASGV